MKGEEITMKEFLKGLALLGGSIVYAIGKALSENNEYEERRVYDYSDAMTAITESDLDDFYKYTLMKEISKNEGSEYYRTVTAIVNSDMDDFYIMQAIKRLKESE